MFTDLIEFLRVLLAMLVVCAGGPFLFTSAIRSSAQGAEGCVTFIRAALFAELATLALSAVGLCLPGGVFAVYLLLGLILAYFSQQWRCIFSTAWWGAVWYELLRIAEDRRQASKRLALWRDWVQHWLVTASLARGRHIATAALLASVAVILATSGAIVHSRFLSAGAYSRALDLQVLQQGRAQVHESSVALLAPVAYLAGVDGAAVIRFSNPLFGVVLGLMAFFVAQRVTQSLFIAWLAASLVPVAALLPDGELQPGGLAAVFLIAAFAVWPVSRWDAISSVLLALLIQFTPSWDTALCLGVLGCLILAGKRLPSLIHLQPATAGLCALAIAVAVTVSVARRIPGDGPFQYESAAKAAVRVSRDFPRNTWLIVSPVQEVALTYGRGWHLELSEFVRKYTAEQVSAPSFRFDFPVQDTFVFLEKTPLVTRQVSLSLPALGAAFDPGIAAYHLRSNRASLQFQAARLIAAYGRSHRVNVFYEDDQIVIIRI